MKKSKLVYVFPEYNPKTPTHFAHLYGFIKKLSESFDVFLIIERGKALPGFKGRIYVQKFRFFPLRILENFAVLKLARFRGYKTFYIHYSFVSAFNSSLLTKVWGGKVFYWNCGLPWKYQRRGRAFFEKVVYKMINFLVTGTEGMKKEYSKHYQIPLKKIKVMPNWIDIQKIQISKSKIQNKELKEKLNIQSQKIILFVHRLSRRKGAHFLPEILKNLKDENITLIVIGDGPECEALKSQITRYKLQNKVRFLGWIPNEEIYQHYALADVFIMPSEEEGFPRVLLETMAMGIPFVSSDVGGVREIIPPKFFDFLVEIGDINNFSLKIKKMLSMTQEELEELKSIEKNWVQKYDISNVIDIFRSIINEE
jgi:glycosyltransferase involved in cell wall biosynthesis